MNRPEDILSLAVKQPLMAGQLELAAEEEVEVKGSFSFSLQRYLFQQALPVEDVAIVVYRQERSEDSPAVQLQYCVTGNKYCNNPACRGQLCMAGRGKEDCQVRQSTLDVVSISFQPGLLSSFEEGSGIALFEAEAKQPFVKTLVPGTKSKIVLEQMVHQSYQGMLKNIFLQSKALELLLYSSDQFVRNDPEEKYGCRFLTHAEDREKVVKARDILLQNLDAPVTIKELSRKVAMNECYLKKGFKAIYGTTIYDYFQKERMERARHLLYEKGLSVSEVAMLMGYSCISHFSTAFKKHTGLKPCELLLR